MSYPLHLQRTYNIMTGEELKKLREAKGLTQTELGQIIGTTHPVISAWENGRQKISKVYQRILMQYFKV
jgi:transcriptional regulator with XRE-family HTH domain